LNRRFAAHEPPQGLILEPLNDHYPVDKTSYRHLQLGSKTEMKTKPLHFCFLVAVLSILLGNSASAQPTKLNVGYSAISGDQLPAWIAKETEIFKKNGLEVQLIYFTGGTTTVQALVSGEVPISQVAGPAVVNSALAGSDIVVVAGGATSLDYWLMSRPEIKRPDQLKGGSVAISAFGTASTLWRATRSKKSV
jgi:ABC-type nitrate/sulfonate/bicarbonate transport system substrate-binding protein